MKTSQNSKILRHLMKGKKITPIQALNLFGCFRLASRISELKNVDGFPIITTMVTKNKKRFAEYSLEHEASLGI